MANLLQWGMGIYSLISNNKTALETWDFRDKQGSSVFGNAKVMGIGFEANGTVVSQPVEENSFFSYNQTSEPNHISCVLCFEGTVQYLQSSLNIVDRYKKGMDALSIVTPYAEYENMKLESYSYTRDVTNGHGLLYIQCEFREIQEVQAAYSSTDVSELPAPITDGNSANPSDASTVDTGMTSTTTPDSQTKESSESALHKIKRRVEDAAKRRTDTDSPN